MDKIGKLVKYDGDTFVIENIIAGVAELRYYYDYNDKPFTVVSNDYEEYTKPAFKDYFYRCDCCKLEYEFDNNIYCGFCRGK